MLGILIRSKLHNKSQTSSAVKSKTTAKAKTTITESIPQRSYTPPPLGKTSSNDSKTPSEDSKDGPIALEDSRDDADDSGSYTPPPLADGPTASLWNSQSADDEPYDPEEADLSLPPIASTSMTQSSQPSIEQLMEQIANSTNPTEMATSVMAANSSNVDLQRRLLEELTQKVEEQRRELEQKRAAVGATSDTTIPGLDGQFAASTANTRSGGADINYADILSSVKQVGAQDQGFRLAEDPIVEKFGTKGVSSLGFLYFLTYDHLSDRPDTSRPLARPKPGHGIG